MDSETHDLTCPYCGHELTGINLDIGVCECDALFEVEGDVLRFEGGEKVHA